MHSCTEVPKNFGYLDFPQFLSCMAPTPAACHDDDADDNDAAAATADSLITITRDLSCDVFLLLSQQRMSREKHSTRWRPD